MMQISLGLKKSCNCLLIYSVNDYTDVIIYRLLSSIKYKENESYLCDELEAEESRLVHAWIRVSFFFY